MARVPLTFTVNGSEQAEFIESGAILVDVLRDKLGLMSTKVGCQQGTCGSCTVTIDGELALACLVPAQRVEGRHVGLVDDVMTSGHTLGELAATFKRFGAARVTNFVFARTPPHP